MNNKIILVLVALLAVGAFLGGSIWTKTRMSGGEEWVVGSGSGSEGGGEGEVGPSQPEFSPPKSEKPTVKFFVMSFCPFGNQAEAGLKPAYDLLKDKVDWQPRYIVGKTEKGFDSLHGEQELNQNVRELCVFNLNGIGKYWDFVGRVNENCDYQNVDDCWLAQAKAVGIGTYPVSSCEKTQAEALLSTQIEEAGKYQAYASPMVFVNDELYDGGRTPEDYKLAICSAFETEPEECSTVLSATSEAAAGGCQ